MRSAASWRSRLVRCAWILSAQFGLAPHRLLAGLRQWPRYMRERRRFARLTATPLEWMPCLHDRSSDSGDVRSEYFLQDLLVAQRVHQAAPDRLIDVGSRVDGFVAHVASFRCLDVLDVRPLPQTVTNVRFVQGDVTDAARLREAFGIAGDEGAADAVSCLHVLEHIGLGRYGDTLDPDGPARALSGLAVLLRTGGVLYLSTPIGRPRIAFNANRVFDARTLTRDAAAAGLVPRRLTCIDPSGGINEMAFDPDALSATTRQEYLLAVFEFTKVTV